MRGQRVNLRGFFNISTSCLPVRPPRRAAALPATFAPFGAFSPAARCADFHVFFPPPPFFGIIASRIARANSTSHRPACRACRNLALFLELRMFAFNSRLPLFSFFRRAPLRSLLSKRNIALFCLIFGSFAVLHLAEATLGRLGPDHRLGVLASDPAVLAAQSMVGSCFESGSCVVKSSMAGRPSRPVVDLSMLSANETPCLDRLFPLFGDEKGQKQGSGAWSGFYAIRKDGSLELFATDDFARRGGFFQMVLKPSLQSSDQNGLLHWADPKTQWPVSLPSLPVSAPTPAR
jgi:hypothetical protein